MKTPRTIISLICLAAFFVVLLRPDNCHSQDSTGFEKILLVEKTRLKNEYAKPDRKIFHAGKRVSLERYSNDTVLRGKIESIPDSAVIIQNQVIPLSDIRTIRANRDKGVIKAGAIGSSLAAAVTLAGLMTAESSVHNTGNVNPWFFIAGVIADIFTVPVLIAGVIDHVAAKRYHLDRDYKISVSTISINN